VPADACQLAALAKRDSPEWPGVRGVRAASWAVPAAVGLGAFLLFGVQPIVGKAILPWFGGTAAVWITCLLVFQVGLLAGYVYAHWMASRVPLRFHGVIHGGVIAVACFVPILPGDAWMPQGGEALAPLIVPMLLTSVGPRYFALAASGTLLQHWCSRMRPGRSPYPLYAVSNAGSMLALLSYPLIVEPALPVAQQATVWTAGFLIFAGLAGSVAWMVWRHGAEARSPDPRQCDPAVSDPRSRGVDALFWIGWSATGVMLFMATTQHLTINVASTPFLWIIPLAIYLATFIVTFLPRQTYSRPLFALLLLPALAVVCPASLGRIATRAGVLLDLGYRTQAACLLAALVVFLMVCHGELYRRRPEPSRLTAFYLCIALGGALGGAAVALLAPRVFLVGEELHVGIVMALGLLGATVWRRSARPDRHRRWIRAVVPVCSLLTLAMLVQHSAALRRNVVWLERNDYGLLRVLRTEGESGADAQLRLYDGVTLHGAQFVDASRRRQATTYYSIAGGGGAVLREFRASSPREIGVIGLGAGTLATHGRRGDHFRFYEINPNVVAAAREQFRFLSGSQARCDIELGDARLALEREPAQGFDILVLDAFSSDAIPVHLLTVEAFELYLRHLRSRGVIAAHISNRSLDLSPLFYGLADRFGLNALNVVTLQGRPEHLIFHSNWMILTRNTDLLDRLTEEFRPWVERGVVGLYVGVPERYRSVELWTDDYSNLLRVLK